MAHEHHHHNEEHCEHCHHEHHHHHHEEEEGHGRLIKIIAAAVLLVVAVIIEKKTDWATWQYLLMYLIPYLIVGWDTLKEAAEGLLHGEALSEDFLIAGRGDAVSGGGIRNAVLPGWRDV